MVSGISVVIPNYNGAGLFPHTIHTVYEALINSGKPHEIIVADDCSTDSSVNYLQKNYPAIKIVINQTNSGFSITANQGIRSAEYDKVLLLNSDVKLTPDYFNNQLKYFDKPCTFGVMGRIIGWDDDNIQDGAKYLYFHGVKIKTSKNYLLAGENEMKQGLYSAYLSGANAFIDKEKFLTIGGFNELFSPFYVEDAELSLRAWRLGYKCYFDYDSICRHKTSSSVIAKDKEKFIKTIYNRNKFLLHALHLEGGKKVLWYMQWLSEILLQIIMGRFYLWDSCKQFLSRREGIRKSLQQFEVLARQNNSHLGLNDVAAIIKQNIQSEAIYF